jgi:hypothetical protein
MTWPDRWGPCASEREGKRSYRFGGQFVGQRAESGAGPKGFPEAPSYFFLLFLFFFFCFLFPS